MNLLFLSISDCTDNLVYQFVFDVSAIADDEAVLQSTLRVYFENSQSIASATRSKDSILATLGYSNGTSVTSKSLYGTSSQWVEFEVGSSVDDWRALKIPLDFTIQLDYLRDNGPHTNIGCDDSTFSLVSDSHSDTNKHALLVVYTDQANMDIFKGLEAAMETKARETRSVSQPGTLAGPSRCGPKTEVLVGKDWLNNIFKPYSFEMLLPNNIELNVCGGNCDNNLSNAPHHAALLSEYISDPAHSVQSQFQKCCVPIEYTAMVILTRRTITVGQTTLKLERIEDATASRCGCIYTYNSTQT